MAVRISGVTIPDDKRVEISITYVFGVGRSLANKILEKANIDKDRRVKDLKDEEVNRLREIIEKEYIVEGDLRREVKSNIKRLKEINCYRGERHSKKLPLRGQSTKNNSRTARK
jgi:small subunit ribosomal protein S13